MNKTNNRKGMISSIKLKLFSFFFNRNPTKYFKNKKISKWAYMPKDKLVDLVFKLYKDKIAVEPDRNELNSSNYIFWITNNLVGMYQTQRNVENMYDDVVNKYLEGPCYNLTGTDISKQIVLDTHKHVRSVLLNMSEKDLYSLIGVGLYLH